MNKLVELFESKQDKLLSIYFTAGYPELNDTTKLIRNLDKSGVDFIEVGFPFSDPLADGPVIQNSSQKAIENGMNLPYLFKELEKLKGETTAPLILMGYLNPVLQFGVADFLETLKTAGVSGIIIPDMPLDFYEREMKDFCEEHNIVNIMLITPETEESRILEIDRKSTGFIYMVSSNSVTGIQKADNQKELYFKRVSSLPLENPLITGFGIYDNKSFQEATAFSRGGIIGSAFIRHIEQNGVSPTTIQTFIKQIKS